MGRIVEVRVTSLADLADVECLVTDVMAAVREAGPGAVICADYRGGRPVSPTVAKAWSRAMRNTNQVVSRSALLLDPHNELFNLQMQRIVLCSANPSRRLFPNFEQLQAWLGAGLGGAERAALSSFLSPTPAA